MLCTSRTDKRKDPPPSWAACRLRAPFVGQTDPVLREAPTGWSREWMWLNGTRGSGRRAPC